MLSVNQNHETNQLCWVDKEVAGRYTPVQAVALEMVARGPGGEAGKEFGLPQAHECEGEDGCCMLEE